jgi:hypothetical protein
MCACADRTVPYLYCLFDHIVILMTKAYQLVLTIPISVTSKERSFSKLRLGEKLSTVDNERRRPRPFDDIKYSSDILDNLILKK